MSALFMAQAEPVHERSSRIGQEVLSVRYRSREEAVSHGRNCAAQFANGSPAPAVCPCGAAERSAAAPRPRPSPIAWRQPPDERTHIKRMSLNALSLSLKQPYRSPMVHEQSYGPIWRPGPATPVSAHHVSRTITNAPRATPSLDATTYTLSHRSQCPESDTTARTGEAVSGRQDPHSRTACYL
jgi:hypothetical protein